MSTNGARGRDSGVLIPAWVLTIACGLLIATLGWLVQDRVRLGETVTGLRERVVAIESRDYATTASVTRAYTVLQQQVETRFREYHPGRQEDNGGGR